MPVREFKELSEPIEADPRRAERITRYRAEALAEREFSDSGAQDDVGDGAA